MAFKFNPLTGELDLDSGSPFVTNGTDGVTTIRWQASDNSLWDMTLDATGAVVTTAVVVSGSGRMIATGPMFGLTYAS